MIAGTVQPKVRFTSTPAAFRRVGNTPNWPRSIIISSIVEAPQQNIRPILRSNGVVGLPYVPKMFSISGMKTEHGHAGLDGSLANAGGAIADGTPTRTESRRVGEE